MAVRTIVSLPEPVLRRKAHKVTQFDKDLKVLIDDMVETMRVAPGVGLAAPQVGISSRIIVVEFGKEEDDEAPKKLFAMVNPELTFPDEEKVVGVEACLSVPDLAGEVERYVNVVVKGLDRNGKPIKIKASGWLARILQHETDHLDGIMFTDRATRIWRPEPQTDVEEV